MPETDELAFFRIERDQLQGQVTEMKVERDCLRAELREALRRIEHWRSLAEYRERMLAEQRDGTDRRSEARAMDNPKPGWHRRGG